MSDKKPIIIGSRGSDLALWQANFVKDRLTELGEKVEIKIIKTQGDKIQHLSFDKMEGKGFFTKEIEAELIDGNIDLAVHSHKDLETTNPEGLTIAAVSSRANPADLLLINPDSVKDKLQFQLKPNPVVGTSSARRKAG
jgi:hydroxymethylbilane synthase